MQGEGTDQAFLTRTAKGLRDFFGFTAPGDAQTKRNAEWVRQEFEADKQIRPDYLRAAARHPHIFQNDRAVWGPGLKSSISFACNALCAQPKSDDLLSHSGVFSPALTHSCWAF